MAWDVLPRASRTCGNASRVPDLRYSTIVAANTALRRDIDHMSLQRQNWFSGMRAAILEVVSLQESRTGVTWASNAGTLTTHVNVKIHRS